MRDRKAEIERRITQPVPVVRVWDYDTEEMTVFDQDEAARERTLRHREWIDLIGAVALVVALVVMICFVILVIVPLVVR